MWTSHPQRRRHRDSFFMRVAAFVETLLHPADSARPSSRRLRVHLKICSRCRETFRRRMLHSRVRENGSPHLPGREELALLRKRELEKALRAAGSPHAPRRRWAVSGRALAVGAVALVAVVLAAGRFHRAATVGGKLGSPSVSRSAPPASNPTAAKASAGSLAPAQFLKVALRR